MRPGCISLYSYIKPQLMKRKLYLFIGCISLYSYIKPQPELQRFQILSVVYPYIPTSNRNYKKCIFLTPLVVYPYIPTSNRNISKLVATVSALYILIFLHQTATWDPRNCVRPGCISLYSYIKPQLIQSIF